MPSLTDKAWSPYVAGVVIGLLQIPTFILMSTALGASSSFVTVGAHLAALVDPQAASIKYFASHMAGAKNWWQVAIVVGIAIGAFISMRMSGSSRPAVSAVWARATGTTSLWARAPVAFVAGFMMLFGARIAGGCTSGHGISGMAQLAVGSTVAVAAMFAGGMLVANLFFRRV
ncbi:MAG: YeeE/YedE thiosulfate transporter family protein [Hyphomicrobiaceae bacterium]